jgi:DNA-binding MarR family transcriptional regulator
VRRVLDRDRSVNPVGDGATVTGTAYPGMCTASGPRARGLPSAGSLATGTVFRTYDGWTEPSTEAGNKVSEKPPVDPLALENQVCFALSLASRSVVAAYRPVLEPLGLTHPQYLVMLTLWEHEPLSIKGLSELLQLDPGTLSPLVKRIEALGYVRRSRSAADERTLEIVLTEKGRDARELALEVPKEMMRRLDMDGEELVALHATMKKVIAAASKATH